MRDKARPNGPQGEQAGAGASLPRDPELSGREAEVLEEHLPTDRTGAALTEQLRMQNRARRDTMR